MKIMVTGHRGYIGSVLTTVVMEAGHDVIGLDSDLYRRATFGDPAALPSRLPYAPSTVVLDMRDHPRIAGGVSRDC